jgi:GTP pyrophosphokinase
MVSVAQTSSRKTPSKDLAEDIALKRGELFARALEVAAQAYGERVAPTGERVIDHARALVGILDGLRTDNTTQIAALLYGTTDRERAEFPLSDEQLTASFGAEVAGMVRGIVQLMQVTEAARIKTTRQEGAVKDAIHEVPRSKEHHKDREREVSQQAEALRKMLLAMVGDLRVVLVRLASRLRTMRWYAEQKGKASPQLCLSQAKETFDLYAPLANRLGIWQLKWELEDLAFRFVEPETYKRIAHMLEEKRIERQAFIESAIERLKEEIRTASIDAEVSGRPKHIYSIWNKMRGKGVDFGGLYDVRAFRIIVGDVRDCYTVLGIVHNLWQPIPKEFDDYISRPKANGYQSLHTVVVAEDGRPFEVQVRTREMHQFAEYGVAAHWRYKESGKSQPANQPYDEKIAWIRQLFAWKQDISGGQAFEEAAEDQPSDPHDAAHFDAAEWTERLKSASFDDRVYVLTPQARVIDLPTGSTPVDFAYHLHSDLGHRCRGAKVDGAMVPLNTTLKTGQTVEIVTSKAADAGPSRDWLNHHLGYLSSPRARTKVRAYFNGIEFEHDLAQGRARIEKELQRLGKSAVSLDEVAQRLNFARTDDMFIAAAREEFSVRQVEALFGVAEPEESEVLHPARISKGRADSTKSGVLVVGVDKLMTQLARCCKPAPPDAICGFVTRGKGVSIHRADCMSFLRLSQAHAERVIDTAWGNAKSEAVFPVDVAVFASDRQGLLRDVSDVFAREKINVVGVRTQSVKGEARMQFTAEVKDAAALNKALQQIRDVPGVAEARRK